MTLRSQNEIDLWIRVYAAQVNSGPKFAGQYADHAIDELRQRLPEPGYRQVPVLQGETE